MVARKNPAGLIAALLIAIAGFTWQSSEAADETSSCQKFVQAFYDWYVAKSKGPPKNDSPLEIALKARNDVFSAELSKRLKEDVAASAKSPGEVVGLDFDPILASQIDPEKYQVEKVMHSGNSYVVDVYAFIDGKKETKPTVQPELVQSNGKWQFVNFHYLIDKNKKDDLLSTLKILREERQKYKK
jgi:hypothetical protein